MEQINNFQTLSLRDFSAFTLDPFLSIDDDYFYHTQYPRRPEVSNKKQTTWNRKCKPPLQYVLDYYLFIFFHKVGDVRVRFSFAGLSGEMSRLGPAQTVSAAGDRVHDHFSLRLKL